jgi:hypothetical protein
MDFEEVAGSSAFWVLTIVGWAAVVLMLVVLKGMGNTDIMPAWVKIVTFIGVPIISFIWASFMGD